MTNPAQDNGKTNKADDKAVHPGTTAADHDTAKWSDVAGLLSTHATAAAPHLGQLASATDLGAHKFLQPLSLNFAESPSLKLSEVKTTPTPEAAPVKIAPAMAPSATTSLVPTDSSSSGVTGLVKDVATGAFNEIKDHPLQVAASLVTGYVARAALIAGGTLLAGAIAPVVAIPLAIGAATAAVGYLGYQLYEHHDWLNSGLKVLDGTATAADHANVQGAAGEGLEFAAGGIGAGRLATAAGSDAIGSLVGNTLKTGLKALATNAAAETEATVVATVDTTVAPQTVTKAPTAPQGTTQSTAVPETGAPKPISAGEPHSSPVVENKTGEPPARSAAPGPRPGEPPARPAAPQETTAAPHPNAPATDAQNTVEATNKTAARSRIAEVMNKVLGRGTVQTNTGDLAVALGALDRSSAKAIEQIGAPSETSPLRKSLGYVQEDITRLQTDKPAIEDIVTLRGHFKDLVDQTRLHGSGEVPTLQHNFDEVFPKLLKNWAQNTVESVEAETPGLGSRTSAGYFTKVQEKVLARADQQLAYGQEWRTQVKSGEEALTALTNKLTATTGGDETQAALAAVRNEFTQLAGHPLTGSSKNVLQSLSTLEEAIAKMPGLAGDKDIAAALSGMRGTVTSMAGEGVDASLIKAAIARQTARQFVRTMEQEVAGSAAKIDGQSPSSLLEQAQRSIVEAENPERLGQAPGSAAQNLGQAVRNAQSTDEKLVAWAKQHFQTQPDRVAELERMLTAAREGSADAWRAEAQAGGPRIFRAEGSTTLPHSAEAPLTGTTNGAIQHTVHLEDLGSLPQRADMHALTTSNGWLSHAEVLNQSIKGIQTAGKFSEISQTALQNIQRFIANPYPEAAGEFAETVQSVVKALGAHAEDTEARVLARSMSGAASELTSQLASRQTASVLERLGRLDLDAAAKSKLQQEATKLEQAVKDLTTLAFNGDKGLSDADLAQTLASTRATALSNFNAAQQAILHLIPDGVGAARQDIAAAMVSLRTTSLAARDLDVAAGNFGAMEAVEAATGTYGAATRDGVDRIANDNATSATPRQPVTNTGSAPAVERPATSGEPVEITDPVVKVQYSNGLDLLEKNPALARVLKQDAALRSSLRESFDTLSSSTASDADRAAAFRTFSESLAKVRAQGTLDASGRNALRLLDRAASRIAIDQAGHTGAGAQELLQLAEQDPAIARRLAAAKFSSVADKADPLANQFFRAVQDLEEQPTNPAFRTAYADLASQVAEKAPELEKYLELGNRGLAPRSLPLGTASTAPVGTKTLSAAVERALGATAEEPAVARALSQVTEDLERLSNTADASLMSKFASHFDQLVKSVKTAGALDSKTLAELSKLETRAFTSSLDKLASQTADEELGSTIAGVKSALDKVVTDDNPAAVAKFAEQFDQLVGKAAKADGIDGETVNALTKLGQGFETHQFASALDKLAAQSADEGFGSTAAAVRTALDKVLTDSNPAAIAKFAEQFDKLIADAARTDSISGETLSALTKLGQRFETREFASALDTLAANTVDDGVRSAITRVRSGLNDALADSNPANVAAFARDFDQLIEKAAGTDAITGETLSALTKLGQRFETREFASTLDKLAAQTTDEELGSTIAGVKSALDKVVADANPAAVAKFAEQFDQLVAKAAKADGIDGETVNALTKLGQGLETHQFASALDKLAAQSADEGLGSTAAAVRNALNDVVADSNPAAIAKFAEQFDKLIADAARTDSISGETLSALTKLGQRFETREFASALDTLAANTVDDGVRSAITRVRSGLNDALSDSNPANVAAFTRDFDQLIEKAAGTDAITGETLSALTKLGQRFETREFASALDTLAANTVDDGVRSAITKVRSGLNDALADSNPANVAAFARDFDQLIEKAAGTDAVTGETLSALTKLGQRFETRAFASTLDKLAAQTTDEELGSTIAAVRNALNDVVADSNPANVTRFAEQLNKLLTDTGATGGLDADALRALGTLGERVESRALASAAEGTIAAGSKIDQLGPLGQAGTDLDRATVPPISDAAPAERVVNADNAFRHAIGDLINPTVKEDVGSLTDKVVKAVEEYNKAIIAAEGEDTPKVIIADRTLASAYQVRELNLMERAENSAAAIADELLKNSTNAAIQASAAAQSTGAAAATLSPAAQEVAKVARTLATVPANLNQAVESLDSALARLKAAGQTDTIQSARNTLVESVRQAAATAEARAKIMEFDPRRAATAAGVLAIVSGATLAKVLTPDRTATLDNPNRTSVAHQPSAPATVLASAQSMQQSFKVDDSKGTGTPDLQHPAVQPMPAAIVTAGDRSAYENGQTLTGPAPHAEPVVVADSAIAGPVQPQAPAVSQAIPSTNAGLIQPTAYPTTGNNGGVAPIAWLSADVPASGASADAIKAWNMTHSGGSTLTYLAYQRQGAEAAATQPLYTTSSPMMATLITGRARPTSTSFLGDRKPSVVALRMPRTIYTPDHSITSLSRLDNGLGGTALPNTQIPAYMRLAAQQIAADAARTRDLEHSEKYQKDGNSTGQSTGQQTTTVIAAQAAKRLRNVSLNELV